MDPRSGLDDMKNRIFLNLPGLELRPLGRPARSQSLYRLSYLGSYIGRENYLLFYVYYNKFKTTLFWVVQSYSLVDSYKRF
jgi:hypothetical protein